MNYFIRNKNEIVGLFASCEDAEVYALKKIDMEILKIYRHNLMLDMEQTSNSLQQLRRVEELMENIAELEIEDKTNLLYKVKKYHLYATGLLSNSKYNVDYTVEYWVDDIIKSFFV